MLTIYLIALAIGGTLIAISLLFGGDASGDADFDADADMDADADVDHDFDLGGLDLWLPFASIRFWIFFSAFFGLAGTLFSTVADVSSTTLIAGVSVATGYACGVFASGLVKWLSNNESDSSVREQDMVGARAEVLLPVGRDRVGKVRLFLKEQLIDARAVTDDDTEYPVGTTVMIYDTKDDGEVLVTKADENHGSRL